MRRDSLSRRVGNRTPKKTVVVVCEGTRTEPQYLSALAREHDVQEAAAVDLVLEGEQKGEVPLTLVRRALDLKSRSRGESAEIDEIWCVFDVEWPRNHPNLTEAMELAAANGISVAVSNPCFEIWLALHFQDCTRFLDNDDARRLRRQCDGRDDKHVRVSEYMPRRWEAAERARRLDAMHSGNATSFPGNNPSSGMHRLIHTVSSPAMQR